MEENSSSKLKLLCLLKMLEENTDQENGMTMKQIIDELRKSYKISAERKSIYADFKVLEDYASRTNSELNIEARDKGKKTNYFMPNRLFELAELKLLVDAVQCSKFITIKKSRELIRKIESLASKKQAQALERQVCITNRVKTINEKIYYNVDSLYTAISQNKKVKFKYFDYNVKKKKVYRKNGDYYTASPYSLSWDDENYYLISFSSKYEDFTHYRVDRMEYIELLDEMRDQRQEKSQFDVSQYTKKVFNMYNGDLVNIKLKFKNELVNTVIDRFGKDVILDVLDENNFYIWTEVAISSTFFGWLAQFGNKVKILSPNSVIDEYRDYIKEIMVEYN